MKILYGSNPNDNEICISKNEFKSLYNVEPNETNLDNRKFYFTVNKKIHCVSGIHNEGYDYKFSANEFNLIKIEYRQITSDSKCIKKYKL